MATGSGKTVVMAMLIAWAFCNRGKVPSDERFPQAALVVCPNLTIKKRLQVLRPEDSDNYYDEFELIPTKLRPLLNSGKYWSPIGINSHRSLRIAKADKLMPLSIKATKQQTLSPNAS